MTDPFYSPKRRITRGKQYIGKLDRRIQRFFGERPYARIVEPDPDSSYQLHKVKLTKRLPVALTDLTFDAAESLRSALDQATYPIAVACNARRPDRIHFPAADTSTDFENALAGNCHELPANVLTLLRGFKPYKGGNDVIWALNRIRRQSVHRLIMPVGMATGGVHFERLEVRGGFTLPFPRWNSEKNEIVFFKSGAETQFDYNLQFAFYIAFGEVEGIAGEPVLPFINAAASEVERIVLAIEAESRRIGLIP